MRPLQVFGQQRRDKQVTTQATVRDANHLIELASNLVLDLPLDNVHVHAPEDNRREWSRCATRATAAGAGAGAGATAAASSAGATWKVRLAAVREAVDGLKAAVAAATSWGYQLEVLLAHIDHATTGYLQAVTLRGAIQGTSAWARARALARAKEVKVPKGTIVWTVARAELVRSDRSLGGALQGLWRSGNSLTLSVRDRQGKIVDLLNQVLMCPSLQLATAT